MTRSVIRAHRGDLLSVRSGILLHGCNARGLMNSGVAKAVRAHYPGAYRAYLQAYQTRGLRVGEVIPFEVPRSLPPLVVMNAITQLDCGREPGRLYLSYAGLQECLLHTRAYAQQQGLSVVHFPLIGCGLAQGDWSKVAPMIEDCLAGLETHLWVPVGQEAPASVVFV